MVQRLITPYLSIPDVGDEIQLVEPWTFPLYQESRNEAFMRALGLLDPDTEAHTLMVRARKMAGYPEDHQSSFYFSPGCYARRVEESLYSDYGDDMSKWPKEHREFLTTLWDWLPMVTLPPALNMKVDRVYIRKGNSGYSSLSFRIQDYGPNWPPRDDGKKWSPVKHRFWAKLTDCRRICCRLDYQS